MRDMKKIYKLKGLDCANCAAKMERKIQKIHGVTSVNISFMTEKLILEAPEEAFETVLTEVQKVICRIEPECQIVM